MDDSRKVALHLRLGGLSYREIGETLGLSRQRVQQLISPPPAVRLLVVTRAAGLCESCGLHVGHSGHVHHKNSTNGDTYNDAENLQLLCLQCHGQAHGFDGRKGTAGASGILGKAPAIKPLVCQRCSYQWYKRIDRKPRRCPNCTSTTWARPRPEKED